MAQNTISFVSALLVALHLSSNSARLVKGSLNGYKFPDSCAMSKLSYCFDKGDNYPDEQIAELLKDMRQLKVQAPEALRIGPRFGNNPEEPDCPSNNTTDPIYYIMDENNKVRVVVQSPKLQQIYNVKWCLNEGRLTEDTPHFLKTTTLEDFFVECVSTKMNFEFFVLSEDQLHLEVVRAKGGIPVCCKCIYNAD